MEPQQFVLVHSPIVGPDTWKPVGAELRDRGHHVVVPRLADDTGPPFWAQHTAAVVEAAEREIPPGTHLTLVAHSGAGQLSGHVGRALAKPGYVMDAYILADAGLPPAGMSRLDQLRAEASEFAAELDDVFASGGGFPDWSDDLLAQLVPDVARRARLAAGVRRLPLDYWQETIPDVPEWPHAPCGVLLLSDGYEATAQWARDRGWPIRRLDADNHFFMLVEPATVADTLIELRVTLGAARAG